MPYSHAALVNLYLHAKFHSNVKNFVRLDGSILYTYIGLGL